MSAASLAASPASPIAIVGGGIAGLAAAFRITELLPGVPLKLFEATGRVGGVLRTECAGEYLIEASADNFVTKLPWAHDLCQRIEIADELLPTKTQLRRALVVSHGRVQPVPEAFLLMSAGRLGPILTSPVLSPGGKLRLALEPLIRRRYDPSDESLASFARRRLGKEAFERLVQPLVAGIYAADPEKLSMQATMPQFVQREVEFGSLWRARRLDSQVSDSGARYSTFVAPRQGMAQLVTTLAQQLPPATIELNSPIEQVSRLEDGRGWTLRCVDGSQVQASAVVIATPAPQAGELLAAVDDKLGKLVGGIEHSSTSVVALGVRRDQVRAAIQGFGFVVPQVEQRPIIAASFSSLKFPGRAADDRLLVRVFVGGALQPDLAHLPDDELIAIAQSELAELIGLEGVPELAKIYRWPHSMPQYHVGHLARVEQIESLIATQPGLELAGNAYRGVGIPQCVHSGEQAAERVVDYIKKATG